MSGSELSEEEVAAALRRLLDWPDIARSAQLARFLEYIVDRKLKGDAESIKAYSIAVDVFGRPPDFDPQSDPIVRVQARRLRGLLGQYYREVGAGDPVRIELPVGRYVPEFVRWREEQMAPTPTETEILEPSGVVPARPSASLPGSWFLLALMTIGAAIIAYALSAWGANRDASAVSSDLVSQPSVTVTEFQSLTGDSADVSMAAGLAIELVTDLEQFEIISVGYGNSTVPEGQTGSDYTLSGIVRRQGEGLQYSAILTETVSDAVVWNQVIAVDNAQARDEKLLDNVSGQLSSMLGSPRGPMHRAARTMLANGASVPEGESLYLCRVMFDLYRETSAMSAGERAQRCFAALPQGRGETGPALAARGSLIAEGIPSEDTQGLSGVERFAMAEELLVRAVSAAPVSAFVWEQRGRLHELAGQHEAAEAAYSSALQINPANTDAMAARARHLALLGRREAGEALAIHAINAAPDPPAWYFAVPALEALSDGNPRLAAEYAVAYAEADRELGPVLAVMAGQALGDGDIVNRYLPRVLDLAAFRSRGVLTRLRMRIVDQALIQEIGDALIAAGVPASALTGTF